MPTLIRCLLPDGALHPVDYEAETLAEAAHHEPDDGVYTVTNTYHRTQVLKFDAHLDRLEDSAQHAGIPLQLDRVRLRRALRRMITAANYGDVRFRVTVGQATPDAFILTLEPFNPPSQAIKEQGVRAITAANSARHNAAAKTTDWMHRRKALQDAMPDGIYDTFLLDSDGRILEGLGSNFYAVTGDTLRTAGEGALPGISQQIVFAVAPEIVPVQRDAVRVADLPHLQETFITSSSRGIIPVIEIDGVTIGDGVPGPITRRLMTAYDAWVAAHLEEL